jgi:hypothetical protein
LPNCDIAPISREVAGQAAPQELQGSYDQQSVAGPVDLTLVRMAKYPLQRVLPSVFISRGGVVLTVDRSFATVVFEIEREDAVEARRSRKHLGMAQSANGIVIARALIG